MPFNSSMEFKTTCLYFSSTVATNDAKFIERKGDLEYPFNPRMEF